MWWENVQKLLKKCKVWFYSIFDSFWTFSQPRKLGFMSSLLHCVRRLRSRVQILLGSVGKCGGLVVLSHHRIKFNVSNVLAFLSLSLTRPWVWVGFFLGLMLECSALQAMCSWYSPLVPDWKWINLYFPAWCQEVQAGIVNINNEICSYFQTLIGKISAVTQKFRNNLARVSLQTHMLLESVALFIGMSVRRSSGRRSGGWLLAIT